MGSRRLARDRRVRRFERPRRRWGSHDGQQGEPARTLPAGGRPEQRERVAGPEELPAAHPLSVPGFQAAGLERARPVGSRPRPRLRAAHGRQPLGTRLQGLGRARGDGNRSRGRADRAAGPCAAALESDGQEERTGDRHLGPNRLGAVRAELGHSLQLFTERLPDPNGGRLSRPVARVGQRTAGSVPRPGLHPRSSRSLCRPHRMSPCARRSATPGAKDEIAASGILRPAPCALV
jgi:hypothetical protein